MKAYLFTSVMFLSGALLQAIAAYPVVCKGGPGMSISYESSRNLILLEARPAPQGANASPPGPGQCAWLDRPMTRPGETTPRGTLIFEIPVSGGPVVVSITRSGTVVKFRDEFANRIWQGATGRSTFRFMAGRKGEGVYAASEGGGPSVRVAPAPPPPQASQPPRRNVPQARAAPGSRSQIRGPVSVEIVLTRLEVHDDADNVSPGDWKVIMMALKGDRNYVTTNQPGHASERLKPVQWPLKGTKNVSSGKTYNPGLAYYVHNVRPTDWISVSILAVDCDANGPLAIRKISDLFPLAVIERNIRWLTRTQRCSGEEVYEMSGAHDRAGKIITLPPQDWRSGRTFRYRISGDGLDFTAHIRVRVLR